MKKNDPDLINLGIDDAIPAQYAPPPPPGGNQPPPPPPGGNYNTPFSQLLNNID